MKNLQHLRLAALSALLIVTALTTSVGKPQKPVRSFPRVGFWVVETTPQHRQCLVRFYNNEQQLIYEETISHRLKIKREQTQVQLNRVLDEAITQWSASQPIKADQKLVARQLKK